MALHTTRPCWGVAMFACRVGLGKADTRPPRCLNLPPSAPELSAWGSSLFHCCLMNSQLLLACVVDARCPSSGKEATVSMSADWIELSCLRKVPLNELWNPRCPPPLLHRCQQDRSILILAPCAVCTHRQSRQSMRRVKGVWCLVVDASCLL